MRITRRSLLWMLQHDKVVCCNGYYFVRTPKQFTLLKGESVILWGTKYRTFVTACRALLGKGFQYNITVNDV